jgi:hypothetical protein
LSSGKNSWTREVRCSVIVPIRIDPNASAKEAEEQVRQLIIERQEGYLEIPVEQLTITALPLEDESPVGGIPPEGGIIGATEEDIEDLLRNIRG